MLLLLLPAGGLAPPGLAEAFATCAGAEAAGEGAALELPLLGAAARRLINDAIRLVIVPPPPTLLLLLLLLLLALGVAGVLAGVAAPDDAEMLLLPLPLLNPLIAIGWGRAVIATLALVGSLAALGIAATEAAGVTLLAAAGDDGCCCCV